MRLDRKDAVGAAVVICALGAVAVHNGPLGHPDGHRSPVADAGGSVTSPVGEPATAFVDFNVLPMDRDVVLRRQTLVVRGRRIEQIGDADAVDPPLGATIVEGDGSQYLIPGLTDAHVHLRGEYERWLPLFIANGVTTVFNLEGRPGHLALKRRIATGEQEGPTVYTAGRYVSEPTVRTPDDARTEVARQATRGYDFVKLHGDLSAEAYAALTAAGRDHGVPILGHAPRNLPFSTFLQNGQIGLSHAEELIHTALRSLDASEAVRLAPEIAESGAWLIPTLAHFDAAASQWGSPAGVEAALRDEVAAYLPESLRQEWRTDNVFLEADQRDRNQLLQMADFHRPLLRALRDAGVPMLAGTDTPIPTLVPGFSLHAEVEALEQAGLSAYEALATATANAGRFIRDHVDSGARFGTLERGARADIVMLETDPRELTSALRRPSGVMVRGMWYGRLELDAMLERVASAR